MMLVSLPLATLATILLLVGGWAFRNLHELAFVPGLPVGRLARRERAMRRGARACLLLGAVFMVVAVLGLVFPPATGGSS